MLHQINKIQFANIFYDLINVYKIRKKMQIREEKKKSNELKKLNNLCNITLIHGPKLIV